ncbi:MAG: hypothetical protein VB092_00500 [Oscillospiraceae bacterium]|nr:hypothetical protein [Oscillospiraceae bacterium]
MNYPNQCAAGKLVAEEMKLFNSRAGLKTLSWCVFMTIWIESLFTYFFFVSRSMDRVNLYYLLFLAALFLVYLGATVVINSLRRGGAAYACDMIFAAVSYFVSAFAAWLFFSAAWRWHFAETVSNAFKLIMRPTGIAAAVAAAALLLGYAVWLLFEPKNDRLLFGSYYWPGLFLPLLPEIVILLVSTAKQVSSQFAVARICTPICVLVLVCFSVRYIAKAILYRFTSFAGDVSPASVTPPRFSRGADAVHELEKELVSQAASAAGKTKRLFERARKKADSIIGQSAQVGDTPAQPQAAPDIPAVLPAEHAEETPCADASAAAGKGDTPDAQTRKKRALALIEAAKARHKKNEEAPPDKKTVFHQNKD